MTATADYDVARARLMLRDLEKRTRGQSAMLELEAVAADPPYLRGVANRAGLFRLGLLLASAALEADLQVSVWPDGSVSRDEQAPGSLLQIVLTDEAPLPQRPSAAPGPLFACLMTLLVFAVLALAVIGLRTVSQWLGR